MTSLPPLPQQQAPNIERLLREQAISNLIEQGIDPAEAERITERMAGIAHQYVADFKREKAIAESPFKIDDRVHQPIGDKVQGIVVSVYVTLTGHRMVVVEDNNGVPHIFKETQIEHTTKEFLKP